MEPSLLSYVNTAGVLGVLAFMVVAFYRGDVLSKKIHDDMIAETRAATKLLAQEISDRMERAVKDGIVAAISYLQEEKEKK